MRATSFDWAPNPLASVPPRFQGMHEEVVTLTPTVVSLHAQKISLLIAQRKHVKMENFELPFILTTPTFIHRNQGIAYIEQRWVQS